MLFEYFRFRYILVHTLNPKRCSIIVVVIITIMVVVTMMMVKTMYLFLLLHLFHENRLLFIFAPFILKPDTNDTGTETGHLHQLFLHEGVRPWVRVVARPQRVELLLVKDRPHSCWFPFTGFPIPTTLPYLARCWRSRLGWVCHENQKKTIIVLFRHTTWVKMSTFILIWTLISEKM